MGFNSGFKGLMLHAFDMLTLVTFGEPTNCDTPGMKIPPTTCHFLSVLVVYIFFYPMLKSLSLQLA